MNKQIVIVTINDQMNYGNRLQNYALAKLLARYGQVDTALCRTNLHSKFQQITLPLRSLAHEIITTAKEFSSGHYRIMRERRQNCARFTTTYVPDDTFTITSMSGIVPKDRPIDTVVLGSDQIWNYRWLSEDALALRLGSFVGKNTRLISYAASFGVSEVEGNARQIFGQYLPQLSAISVREDRGAELVKELSDCAATVVLDPTLTMTDEEWKAITRGFISDNDRYVLTYFLGRPNDVQEQTIQAYAKQHNCRVRRLFDFRDKETYVAGPDDFVELFNKAQYVFTDSYHACCFSILFHRQFTVFNRAGMSGSSSMNSRMETLFRLFGLNAVVMDNGLAPSIDYEAVDQILKRHRVESQIWLDKAMES